jgi:hypothetical protein
MPELDLEPESVPSKYSSAVLLPRWEEVDYKRIESLVLVHRAEKNYYTQVQEVKATYYTLRVW